MDHARKSRHVTGTSWERGFVADRHTLPVPQIREGVAAVRRRTATLLREWGTASAASDRVSLSRRPQSNRA
jgi:hypothetical protein